MNYMNDHDIAAWSELPNHQYTIEEIEPLRLIAEALDERCVVAGVNMDTSYHVVPSGCPSQSVFDAINAKIVELLPHFIRLDFDDINKDLSLSNFNLYKTQQYTRILSYNEINAFWNGDNTGIYPYQMDSELSTTVDSLNNFYRSCKYWIDKMYAVNVTQHTFLLSVYNSTVDFEEEWAGPHEKLWSYYAINGEEISGSHTPMELATSLSGIPADATKRNLHCDSGWSTQIRYVHNKYVDEYLKDEEWVAGDYSDKFFSIDYTKHPGLCRCQNPAALEGEFHMILQPSRRVESTHTHYTIDDYDTEPQGEYDYSWIEVKSDTEIVDGKLSYGLYNGDWTDGSIMREKETTTYPGHYPLSADESVDTKTYWNYNGSSQLKQEVFRDEIEEDVHTGVGIYDYWDIYAHDGHGIWQIEDRNDKNFGRVNPYSIFDIEMGENVKNPSWKQIEDIIEQDVPPGWVYWDYRRGIDFSIFYDQHAIAYIDYRCSFKYKAE